MAKKEKDETTFTISNCDARSIKVFDNWLLKRGFKGRKAGFYYLAVAMSENRLLIFDKLTKDILVGAAKDETLLEARMTARQEAKVVLYEEGFISDPGGVDMIVRTKGGE
jgi:hypothetical protein